jgi:hypothetical protein
MASAGCRATSAFRLFGRQWFLPFGSSVLIGLIGMAIGRFI